MTLTEIRTAVYALLQIPSGDQAGFDAHFLVALRQAQLKAQQSHDFVLCQGRGYLTVAPTTGSLLSGAKAGFSSEAPTGSTVSFKNIKRAKVRYSATWLPATFMSQEAYDSLVERADRNVNSDERTGLSDGTSDGYYLPLATRNVLTYEGGYIYTRETASVNVLLHGQLWLAPYADINATDFLVEYGHNWLMWEVALQLNAITGTWLPRNEGSHPIPTDNRDSAWQALIGWDAYYNNTLTDLLAG